MKALLRKIIVTVKVMVIIMVIAMITVTAFNPFLNNQINGMVVMEKTEQQPVFLSLKEAQSCAYQGFIKNSWAFPPKLASAMTHTQSSLPLLVQRTDRKDAYFYYIVPFNRAGKTAVLVLIDAHNGDFKEASYMQEPTLYPRVKEEDALQILTAFLKKNNTPIPAKVEKPVLVFEPCEQTQSPYEPLWKIRVNASVWFVDQLGNVYDKIMQSKLKGG